MFIEEKLDLLKQALSKDDFDIRYTDFKAIMSKIETKFLSNKNPNDKYNNWAERLEHFTKSNYIEEPFGYLKDKLAKQEKYWWIYVDTPCHSNSRHRLFEATLLGGERLSFLFSESQIFIVHKKYDWMIMLDRKRKIIAKRKLAKAIKINN